MKIRNCCYNNILPNYNNPERLKSGAKHLWSSLSQWGKDVNIITELERRYTFPAFDLACSFLYKEKGFSRELLCLNAGNNINYQSDNFREEIQTFTNYRSSSRNGAYWGGYCSPWLGMGGYNMFFAKKKIIDSCILEGMHDVYSHIRKTM